jgi:hypothetical protein
MLRDCAIDVKQAFNSNVQPMNVLKTKAPIPISFFAKVLKNVGNKKIGGFFEVSLPETRDFEGALADLHHG